MEIKPITIVIEESIWKKFKEQVPRTITLNEKVVELIKQEVLRNE